MWVRLGLFVGLCLCEQAREKGSSSGGPGGPQQGVASCHCVNAIYYTISKTEKSQKARNLCLVGLFRCAHVLVLYLHTT